jgi:hypothetical protein
MSRRERMALLGLRLPVLTLRKLQESGIYCVPTLSVVRQRTTQQYLIRAQECGGAVADLGAYCGFSTDDGTPLGWFQKVETIGVNGLHARALCRSLVRIQIVRVMHTYDLLITHHALQSADNGRRPTLSNTVVFYGRQGTLELELWGKDKELRGRVYPVFYDRGGDPLSIPPHLNTAVYQAVAGVTCCGCQHSHLLTAPESDELGNRSAQIGNEVNEAAAA